AEQRLDLATQLLAMLQRARRVERHPATRALLHHLRCKHFAQIAGDGRDAPGLGGIAGILRQEVPVFLYGHAAAARRHDDRLDLAALERRPPGVDQRTHVAAPVVLVVEMETDRSAAAGAWHLDERDADAIEHARRGGIDGRRERRLYAAGEHQHLARVARRRPAVCV